MVKHKAVHDDSAREPNELTAHSLYELREMIEFEGWEDDEHSYFQVHTCRGGGCEAEYAEERHDAHGITTGHYCDECYENNYPYRKDKYPTIETHGYGERLSEDY
tara:strand:+ start:778 stop:1092 length:315 start_codon:yes stop_codon:yes gene_type:complete